MRALADLIDRINKSVGRTVMWFALLIVLIQFVVVVMRYVFGIGSIFAQESITYLHGFLFMLAAAFTLLVDGHVRVDIFYVVASWSVLEGSPETSGIQARYLQKTAILGFAVMMALQGVSIAIRSLLAMGGDELELDKLRTGEDPPDQRKHSKAELI